MRGEFTFSFNFIHKDKPWFSIDGFIISSFLYKEFVIEIPKISHVTSKKGGNYIDKESDRLP